MGQDGETLAIGGNITERVNRSKLGIPFLMDIPVFGRFFGTTRDDIDRTELIMLITPHVIRNREEARTITEEFKERLSTARRELEKRREKEEKPPESAPSPESELKEAPGDQGGK